METSTPQPGENGAAAPPQSQASATDSAPATEPEPMDDVRQ